MVSDGQAQCLLFTSPMWKTQKRAWANISNTGVIIMTLRQSSSDTGARLIRFESLAVYITDLGLNFHICKMNLTVYTSQD